MDETAAPSREHRAADLRIFDKRPQNTNVIYAISDQPMSAEEWKKQYVTGR